MAIKVETEDPGVKGIEKMVKQYVKLYPDYADAIGLYGEVMILQRKALDDIGIDFEMSADDVDRVLRDGNCLLEPGDVAVEPGRYGELIDSVAAVVEKRSPSGFPFADELRDWELLELAELPSTVEKVVRGEEVEVEPGWIEFSDMISRILWEALVPFYRKYGRVLQNKIDHAVWLKGFCPVCGTRPLMGKFRSEDGRWLLECSLCRTLWNVQRARCPFCGKSKDGSLPFLYIDDNRKKRVQYCSECKRYVKTVDLRDSDRKVLLPLEDIATFRLDLAADQENLKVPEVRIQ